MIRMESFCDELTPQMIIIAKEELGETENTKIRCLEALKDLVKEVPDFNPCLDDTFLLRFLRVRKFNVDEAFKSLLKYYTYKARYSRITTDFTPSELMPILEQDNFTILKYRDQNDVGVGLIRFEKFDVDKFTCDQGVSSVISCSDIFMQMESVQILGYSLIFDLAGVTLKMARKASSPAMLYRLVAGIKDYAPARIKAYHFVNEPIYCDVAFAIIKRLLGRKLRERLHFHGSDLKSLHQHIPPDILPEELGGTQGPNSKYCKEFRSIILTYEDYVIKMNQFGFKGETLNYFKKGHLNILGF